MKEITTKHTEIGYTNNLEIVATALRGQFGFDDNSHVLTAVAAHIWSGIAGLVSDDKKWGSAQVTAALDQVRARVDAMAAQLARIEGARTSGLLVGSRTTFDKLPIGVRFTFNQMGTRTPVAHKVDADSYQYENEGYPYTFAKNWSQCPTVDCEITALGSSES